MLVNAVILGVEEAKQFSTPLVKDNNLKLIPYLALPYFGAGFTDITLK